MRTGQQAAASAFAGRVLSGNDPDRRAQNNAQRAGCRLLALGGALPKTLAENGAEFRSDRDKLRKLGMVGSIVTLQVRLVDDRYAEISQFLHAQHLEVHRYGCLDFCLRPRRASNPILDCHSTAAP